MDSLHVFVEYIDYDLYPCSCLLKGVSYVDWLYCYQAFAVAGASVGICGCVDPHDAKRHNLLVRRKIDPVATMATSRTVFWGLLV